MDQLNVSIGDELLWISREHQQSEILHHARFYINQSHMLRHILLGQFFVFSLSVDAFDSSDRKSLMPFVLLLRIRQLAIQIGSSSFASPDYSGFALRGNVRIYSLISSASCMRSINAGIIRTRRSQDRHATHVSCLMQNRGTRENA